MGALADCLEGVLAMVASKERCKARLQKVFDKNYDEMSVLQHGGETWDCQIVRQPSERRTDLKVLAHAGTPVSRAIIFSKNIRSYLACSS